MCYQTPILSICSLVTHVNHCDASLIDCPSLRASMNFCVLINVTFISFSFNRPIVRT